MLAVKLQALLHVTASNTQELLLDLKAFILNLLEVQ